MGSITLGLASSHAFALMDPAQWDHSRLQNRKMYERLYGVMPPDQPDVAAETDAVISDRFAHIKDAHAALRARLEAEKPDALIIVGDDQNENFTEANVPQFAVFIGDDFVSGRLTWAGENRKSHRALAEAILTGCVEADIDMSSIRKFPENRLFSHAFGPVLEAIDPERRIPVVPVFVNAIHMPAPSPARCYYLGQTLRRIVEQCGDVGRVAICASGGLSHFTAGFPWAHRQSDFTYGSIDQDFDAWLIDRMSNGDGAAIGKLTTKDLLSHGEIELRNWIVALGALGDAKPDLLVYEPLYRGLIGMSVASWPGAQVPA